MKSANLPFLIGGSAFTLLVITLVSVVYNSIFDSHSDYATFKYGEDRSIHHANICIVIFGIVSFIAIFLASCVMMADVQRAIRVGFMLATVLLTAAEMYSQLIGLNYSLYGDALIPTRRNYLSNDAFRKYVETHYAVGNAALKLPENMSLNIGTGKSALPDFYVDYAYKLQGTDTVGWAYVPSCKFEFPDDGNFTAQTDACKIDFGSVTEVECVGAWNKDLFKEYVCKQAEAAADAITSPYTEKSLKDLGAESRKNEGLYSKSAYFVFNMAFILLEAVCFIMLIVTFSCGIRSQVGTGDGAGEKEKKKKKKAAEEEVSLSVSDSSSPAKPKMRQRQRDDSEEESSDDIVEDDNEDDDEDEDEDEDDDEDEQEDDEDDEDSDDEEIEEEEEEIEEEFEEEFEEEYEEEYETSN